MTDVDDITTSVRHYFSLLPDLISTEPASFLLLFSSVKYAHHIPIDAFTQTMKREKAQQDYSRTQSLDQYTQIIAVRVY